MPAALAALKKIQATLASAWSGCEERKKPVTASHGPWLEPGPLPRATKTWGCRLPKLDLVAEAYKKHQNDNGKHEVDASLSTKLAGDLARPFGQSTGRGFSFTRFRIDHFYSTLVMRQQDAFAPWIGPDRTVSLQTLYEIGRLVTHADPICGHLQWGEEYSFLVPNLANFGLHQRFSEDETRRITAFSFPIAALNNEVAPLMAGETANMHPRLRSSYSAPRRPEGRLLVFTVWKSLGKGFARCMYWRPHQTSAPPERLYPLGHIRYCFDAAHAGEHTYKIDVAEIQQCIASVLESRREAPPEYAAVVEPGYWVIEMDKEE
ncbi:hypothetical protein B0T26DRAFT_681578 [Lasiosphaeria miniovina]|uniref:Uncharacterized protein n=1 Tax=Lasiosphaeria miniovina TaxID=1954250 RepID=A0AA39ZUQ9_9PEZI|nr:uncharacterized protein B0T26DRAFT_681578 [Lasiosphaeria miniovina]KAK0703958.1 hypothetical protein B0T26DRAFT_681578 [Lasiosphaeria miniovina]